MTRVVYNTRTGEQMPAWVGERMDQCDAAFAEIGESMFVASRPNGTLTRQRRRFAQRKGGAL